MRKILTEVYVPMIEEKYDIFIPNNKSVKTVIKLLERAVNELSDGSYQSKSNTLLYNKKTGQAFDPALSIKDSNIVNGTKLILL